MAVRAREIGFAFESTHNHHDDSMSVLSVRFDEPNHLVWTIFPPERLPMAKLDGAAGIYLERRTDFLTRRDSQEA